MSDTNPAVQPEKMVSDLKYWIYIRKKRDCSVFAAKTKALISWVVTAQLTMQQICDFVFAYAKSRFSQDAAMCQTWLKTPKTCFLMMRLYLST